MIRSADFLSRQESISIFLAGECQFTVTTDPVPGVNGYFPDAQNITLVCQVNEGGSGRATIWSKQTSLDREEGRGRQFITFGGDNNFLLSSQENIGQFGIPDTSILTIVSLTEDLNTTIIFCGFEEPLANFTIRIYCELVAGMLTVAIIVVMIPDW